MAGKGKRKARIILTLAAYALAGLVTSLGIAWSGPPDRYGMVVDQWTGPAGPEWKPVPPGTIVQVSRWRNWRSTGYISSMPAGERPDLLTGQGMPDLTVLAKEFHGLKYTAGVGTGVRLPRFAYCTTATADFHGFPFRCVCGGNLELGWADMIDISYRWAVDLGPMVGGSESRAIVITVKPVWPGLIANTAIWGLAWYVLLFVPLRLLPWSAASRKRRGLCIECGYDLTGATGRCPECGGEVAAGAEMVEPPNGQMVK